jgi:hypothetical protein
MAMPDFHQSPDPAGKNDPSKEDKEAEPRRPAPADEPPSSASAAPRPLPPIPLTEATITFHDDSGALWWAHEVSGEALGAPGRMCLLLISGRRLRRVWRYPPNWRSLPWTEILALPEETDD